MKKSRLFILSLMLISAVAMAGSCSDSKKKTVTPTGGTTATTLYLVGDSTVCGFTDAYYYPRYGYGTQIANYLNTNVTVNNLALSGRSSKSFITETNYTTLTSSLKAGDYLMIGFGHNDEKAESSLYTNPNGAVTDVTSFKYYLKHYYIDVALAAGATPILCTPIVRRSPTGAYTGAVVHVTADATSGGTTYPGGDYPQAIRDLGTAYGITVIDMTALTTTLDQTLYASAGASGYYASTGVVGTLDLHAWVSNKPASVDNTHINIYGASYYAYIFANALTSTTSALKDYVLSGITAPGIATLVVNPSYVVSTYAAPTIRSTTWTTAVDPWWGTVFGDCGGAAKIIDGVSFSIVENSSSNISIKAGTSSTGIGKISNTCDGIAMCFQKIAYTSNWTMSATATVGSYLGSGNSQVAFGLMVRDAVWIDTFDASLASNQVTCGPLKMSNGTGAWWTSFIRDTSVGAPTGTVVGSTTATVPTIGTVVNLKIVKSGDSYTVTYGTEAPVTYTLDLHLTDSDYVYVGPFCARQADVTFSNIVLTIQ
jgi:lysophospholipase L1-like esterase